MSKIVLLGGPKHGERVSYSQMPGRIYFSPVASFVQSSCFWSGNDVHVLPLGPVLHYYAVHRGVGVYMGVDA